MDILNSEQFDLKFHAYIKYDEEAKVFVSGMPEIGIYSQGKTRAQAKAALADAIISVIKVCQQIKD